MAVVVKKESVPAQAPASELTVVSKVIKGDTYLVIASAARELDDEFVTLNMYQGEDGGLAVEPPYNPKTLKHLVVHNNVLNQCVHAMEVNIDGTGHEFVSSVDEKEVNKAEKEKAESFFKEPYPGVSFISMRREMRRDIEGMGYGLLEVLRNMAGDVVAIRYLEAQSVRLARLGNPVKLKREVDREGKPVEFVVWERPRRFMQVINSKATQYYKEFGCPLELDRTTGNWAAEGVSLPPDKRATEVLYFGADKDVSTPYHVPKWINEMPSVIGSRKAEEQNLEFFDSGGMPPAIIFIQGGQMIGQAAEQLRTYLSASNKRKGRAVVVELASNAATIDSGGSVSAKVERFGAEKANDAMYANYDQAAEEHVRVGFRLPPLFLGKAADYNYATAVVAYQVAEAQVFGPERTEFDAVINRTIIKALGLKTLKFKSLPITLKSVDETFKGLALVDGKVEGEEFVAEVNKAIGTSMTYVEPPPPPASPVGLTDPLTGLPYDKPVSPKHPSELLPGQKQPKGIPTPPENMKPKLPIKRLELLTLVRKAAIQRGLVEGELDEQARADLSNQLQGLDEQQQAQFTEALSLYSKPQAEHVH